MNYYLIFKAGFAVEIWYLRQRCCAVATILDMLLYFTIELRQCIGRVAIVFDYRSAVASKVLGLNIWYLEAAFYS